MINNIKNFLKNSYSIGTLRNFFNYRPLISIAPKNKNTSVSDFFYWKTNEGFNTKFCLTNLSSQTTPYLSQTELIELFIYDGDGGLLKKQEFDLKPFETKDLIFSEIVPNSYGSFLVFHNLQNYSDYKEKNSFLSERGYIGYSKGNKIWSFMHGNLNCFYLDENKIPRSLMTTSFQKNNAFLPQVSFSDCLSFEAIINNPTYKKINVHINQFDKEMNHYDIKKIKLNPFGTYAYQEKDKNVHCFEIISNFILLRPIVFKNYDTYFDIFHG